MKNEYQWVVKTVKDDLKLESLLNDLDKQGYEIHSITCGLDHRVIARRTRRIETGDTVEITDTKICCRFRVGYKYKVVNVICDNGHDVVCLSSLDSSERWVDRHPYNWVKKVYAS